MAVFEDYYDEDGYQAHLEVEEILDILSEEEKEEMAEMLYQYIDCDKTLYEPVFENIVDADFNFELDNLKESYYKLTKEEEEFLQKLFKKYN